MIDEAELEARGLYDPRAPNAAERLAMLRFLESEGAALDEMLTAQAAGLLVSLAGDRLLQRVSARYTHAELAAQAGMTPEFLERVRRAVGFGPVDPTARLFDDADVRAFAGFRVGAQLLGEEAALDLTRVLGSALARIAESAIALFLVHVEHPIRGAGGGELAMARANRDAMATAAVLPATMDGLLRRHMQEAIRRFRLSRDERAAPNTRRMAVGFVDLVGFTPMASALAPAELARILGHFEGRAQDLVAAHEGRVVKLIGDEVMFVALDAGAACEIALSLIETFRTEASDVTPRGGLAVGPLLMRGGDYYGVTVNLASRIADLAVPFEILVTADVVAQAAGYRFEPAGRRMLKGFADPIALFSAGR